MINDKKNPKEIQERVNQMNQEKKIMELGVVQGCAMIDKTTKLFVASKQKSGIHEKYALEMAIGSLATVMADIMAYAYHQKYLGNMQEEVIKVAQQIHDLAINIVEDKDGKSPGSEIITS